MVNQQNIEKVAQIKEMVSGAKSIVMANYQGLTHQQLEQLRMQLEKNEGRLTVVKNALLLRALKELNVEGIEEDKFTGPIGVVVGEKDEVTALQVFSSFIKAQGAGEIKFGVLDGKFYPKSKIIRLSKLPGIEGLRAQVVGTIASPLSGLVGVLSGNTRKLVVALAEIKKKKESN